MSDNDRSQSGGDEDGSASPKGGRDSYRDDRRGGGGGGRRFTKEVCYRWPEGNCTYGDRCRFAHEGPGGSSGGGDDRRGGGGGGGRGGSGGGSGNSRELFLRGLDYDMNRDDIREELLSGIRGHVDIVLPMNRDAYDRNRGFCIIKFASENDARGALKKLDGTECRGRGIYARWSEDFGGGGGGDRGDRGDRSDRRDNRSQVCFRWQETGSCRYGNDCRFEHDGGRSRSGGGGGRRYDDRDRRGGGGGRSDVCYSFERDGTCSYGNSCRFSHDTGGY